MNLAHIVSLRLLRGAGTGVAAPAVSTVIGRRRRTRTYKAPNAEGLKESYDELLAAAPGQVRKIVKPYTFKPPGVKKPEIDWTALAHDAEAVVKLLDLYLEYIEEEDDISVLLMSDF